jgi:hypothetical protein
MSNLRSYARLTFKTEHGTFNVQSSGNKPEGTDAVNATILKVTTAKNLSNSSGSFSINLSPRIPKAQYANLGTTYLPDLIKPYNLVQIEFKTDEKGYKTEMVGFVTRASVKLSIDAKGAPTRIFNIEGFDLTRAFQNYIMYFNPFITAKSPINFNGILYSASKEGEKIFRNQNAAGFIKTFLGLVFSNLLGNPNQSQRAPYYGFYFNPTFKDESDPVTIKVDKGIRLDSLIDFNSGISTVFSDIKMTDPYIILEMCSGEMRSIWDIAKSYSDVPFHEVFMDLRRPRVPYQNPEPGKPPKYLSEMEAENTHNINDIMNSSVYNPTLTNNLKQPYVFYMRTSPFSYDSWSNLTYHYFSTADILMSDVSTSEENIYNYYELLCERENVFNSDTQLSLITASSYEDKSKFPRLPIFDYQSILRYGLRKFPASVTKYVDFVTRQNGDKTTALDSPESAIKGQCTLMRELFRWFSFGEDFECGTLVLKGRVGVGALGASMGSRLIELNVNSKSTGAPTGKEYYIEGVSQNFEIGSPMTTTLAVSRGHFPFDYQDKSSGKMIKGRFNKLKQRESELKIQQKGNEKLFFDVPI